MNVTALRPRLLAIALLAMGGSVALAQAAEKPAAPTARADAAKEKAKASAEAKTQRDAIIKEHEALATELKNASAERRKEILAKMEERMKAFEEAQKVLHQQMRDEQRRARQDGSKR